MNISDEPQAVVEEFRAKDGGNMQIVWHKTKDDSHQSQIGPWSIEIALEAVGRERPWTVYYTYQDSPRKDYWFASDLQTAKEDAARHAMEVFDFDEYNRLSPELLAKILFNGVLLGLGDAWEAQEPDTGDERYQRCLVAARQALDHLWNEDAPVQFAEPLVASDAEIYKVYTSVDNFVFSKINQYYVATGEGISTSMWRRQCRCSEAAARRAVGYLIGEGAMRQAQDKMDAHNAEQEAKWEAEREARKVRKKVAPVERAPVPPEFADAAEWLLSWDATLENRTAG